MPGQHVVISSVCTQAEQSDDCTRQIIFKVAFIFSQGRAAPRPCRDPPRWLQIQGSAPNLYSVLRYPTQKSILQSQVFRASKGRTIKSMLHTEREGKNKLPSVQERGSGQGTENREPCNYIKKYTAVAEGYVQTLTYKHSWNHKETAALGKKIWSVLWDGLQVTSGIFTTVILVSALSFSSKSDEFNLLNLSKAEKHLDW